MLVNQSVTHVGELDHWRFLLWYFFNDNDVLYSSHKSERGEAVKK